MRSKQSRFVLMLVSIIACGVLICGIGVFFWYQQNIMIEKLKTAINAKTQDLTNVKNEIAKYDDEVAKLTETNEKLSSIASSIENPKYIPSYLREMQDRTLKTRNIIMSLQPADIKPLNLAQSFFSKISLTPEQQQMESKESTADGFRIQSINLSVQGNYVSLIRLLDAFRQFPKLIYVKTLDISPIGANVIGSRRMYTKVNARISTYAIITPDQYRPKTSMVEPVKAEAR